MRHYHYHRHHRLYRSRGSMILGVCQGLADYFNVPAFGIRAAAVLLLIFTGFWPAGALYILAGLVLKPEPLWSR